MELFGDRLAAAAQVHARRLDPERKGVRVAVLLEAVQQAGDTVRGDPKVSLASALNHAQHRFSRVGQGLWAWKETETTDGLSGTSLLDEAYLVAKRLDPDRVGVHYETIKAAIQEDGARIAGGNPGNTLFNVMRNASTWFEAAGDGLFRWR